MVNVPRYYGIVINKSAVTPDVLQRATDHLNMHDQWDEDARLIAYTCAMGPLDLNAEVALLKEYGMVAHRDFCVTTSGPPSPTPERLCDWAYTMDGKIHHGRSPQVARPTGPTKPVVASPLVSDAPMMLWFALCLCGWIAWFALSS